MNRKIVEVIEKNETDGIFSHIHVTGNEESLKKLKEELKGRGYERLKYTDLRSYLYDMPSVMATSDLLSAGPERSH
jgi:UDP-N-acetylglucosamine:LPS N-acetylglucosamine transferase